MIDYSKVAFAMVFEDLKKWSKGFKIGFNVFTILYFAYVFLLEKGSFYVNIVLVSLYVIYTIFELATIKKDMKKTKVIVARSYKWSKLLIKAFTLGSSLYGIYIASTDADGLTIVISTLMIILWIIQVLLEIVIVVMEPKVRLIIAGVLGDLNPHVERFNNLFKTHAQLPMDEYRKELDKLEDGVVKLRAAKIKPKKKLIIKNPFKLIGKKGGK